MKKQAQSPTPAAGEDWLGRWREGRTGWHEAAGNRLLHRLWPTAADGSRVLVPLCGKTPDLAWLAARGCDVTGIELSPLAVEAFFDETGIAYTRGRRGGLPCCRADDLPLAICVGDYFEFAGETFDALYDRGALVALPADRRAAYVAQSNALVPSPATRLVITLEYDPGRADGPPYAVMADELLSYWPALRRVAEHDDLTNAPPKFRAAGLERFVEVAWLT